MLLGPGGRETRSRMPERKVNAKRNKKAIQVSSDSTHKDEILHVKDYFDSPGVKKDLDCIGR